MTVGEREKYNYICLSLSATILIQYNKQSSGYFICNTHAHDNYNNTSIVSTLL